MEYYRAYIEELETTLEELIENMKEKSDRNLIIEKLQTENMDLKRKVNKFTKVIAISQTDPEFCEEETCTENRHMLVDMKHNYDKLVKVKNINKLDNILFG